MNIKNILMSIIYKLYHNNNQLCKLSKLLNLNMIYKVRHMANIYYQMGYDNIYQYMICKYLCLYIYHKELDIICMLNYHYNIHLYNLNNLKNCQNIFYIYWSIPSKDFQHLFNNTHQYKYHS